jgi:hypothetical protein
MLAHRLQYKKHKSRKPLENNIEENLHIPWFGYHDFLDRTVKI